MGKVVLVTGVARQLGGRFVRRVQREPGVDRVIAVDAVAPAHPLGDAEFVRADIRQSALARILARYAVDTVVHLDVSGKALGAGGRTAIKETNVIGTMQLLGACQKSPTVQRLVVKSSTSVYGSAPRDPAVFTETTPPKSLPSGGFAKDAVEVEGYVRGFARRRPDVAVCVLRFANILGPRPDSPLADYLSLPVLPTVFGYDPERAEGERHPRHQLREAAHGLLRVGEQHGPPGAVGLGDGERPVHVHPPPGAEQRPRQPGEHGEAQQPGRPGAEVDTARVPLGGLDGAHGPLREYEGQLVRYSAAVVSPGRGPAAGEAGGPGRIVPGHTVRMLQAEGAGTSADRPGPPPAGPPPPFRRPRLSAAWRRRWRWSS
nr:NAD-dependent epimerase/dehydratase family protein [Streptomyces sp. WAC04770]